MKISSWRASLQRDGAHWLVAMSGWIARVVAVLARLGFMFLLLNYLEVDQYAICAVVFSLEGWFLLADLGLGSSAQNAVSKARVEGSDTKPLLCSIAQLALFSFFLFSCLIVIFSPLFSGFLFTKMQESDEQILSLVIAGISYALLAMGSVAYRVLYALQKGYWVHFFQTVGLVLALIFIWLLTAFYIGEDRIFLSLSCVTAVPALATLWVFFRVFSIRNLFSKFHFDQMKSLARHAFQFWLFGLGAISVLGVDYIVMARVLSSEEILVYHVANRMFMGFFVMYSAFLQAVWPTCSEMLGKGLFMELKKQLRKYILWGFGFMALISLFIIFSSPLLCHLFFSNQHLTLPFSLLGLLGLYYLVRVYCDTYGMVIQSMNRVDILLITVPFQALISCFGQSLFASQWGLYGVILGLVLSYLMTVGWVLPTAFNKIIARYMRQSVQ